MSWSVQKTAGTPAKVKEAVSAIFDQVAKNYEGKTEGKDIADVKAAVAAFCDEAEAAKQTGVTVEASGSRGASWLTIKVDCTSINLLT